jgi:membrane protease YdiL (CAAX protease family)
VNPIHPPGRTAKNESFLIVLLVFLFTLRFYLPSPAGDWILPVAALVTLAAVFKRLTFATLTGVVTVLFLAVYAVPVLIGLWPLSGVVAIGVYAGIVVPADRLRHSSGWARWGSLRPVDFVLCAGISVATALALWAWILLTRPDLSALISSVPDAPASIIIAIGLLFTLFNSFVEEVIFRGVFMYSLEAAFGSLSVALILQAVFFGLMHIRGFPSGPYGIVLAAAFGLVLGYLRIRTKGMLAPWAAHAAVNGMMYAYLVYQAYKITEV